MSASRKNHAIRKSENHLGKIGIAHEADQFGDFGDDSLMFTSIPVMENSDVVIIAQKHAKIMGYDRIQASIIMG